MTTTTAPPRVAPPVHDTVPAHATLLPLVPEAPGGRCSLRLSFSRVDTYRRCPLQFRYAYVDRLPSAPSPDLSWGASVHAALEAWWGRKLPEAPPLEVLWQALYDGWEDGGFDGMPREEKLKWYRHAQEVLRRHHARFASDYVPAVACEQWFEIDVGGGVEVVGSIDHVARTPTGGLGVVDWKTNRRAKPRDRVRGSLQLAIYALACRELWGHDPEWVALDFVVPGVRVTVPREEIDVDAALATVHDVAERIRAGEAFAPRPSALCPWCDYRDLCPAFEGEGPDIPGLAAAELTRLRRRQERDAARIRQLEALIRDRLGPDVVARLG